MSREAHVGLLTPMADWMGIELLEQPTAAPAATWGAEGETLGAAKVFMKLGTTVEGLPEGSRRFAAGPVKEGGAPADCRECEAFVREDAGVEEAAPLCGGSAPGDSCLSADFTASTMVARASGESVEICSERLWLELLSVSVLSECEGSPAVSADLRARSMLAAVSRLLRV